MISDVDIYANLLRQLKGDITRTGPHTFGYVVLRGLCLCNVTEKELLREFGLSRTSFRRWFHCEGEPQEAIKKVVYSYFLKRCRICQGSAEI